MVLYSEPKVDKTVGGLEGWDANYRLKLEIGNRRYGEERLEFKIYNTIWLTTIYRA